MTFRDRLLRQHEAIEDRAVAMASRRAVAKVLEGGCEALCVVVCADADGDSAFTAVRNYLAIKNVTLGAGEFTRNNVKERIAQLYESRGCLGLKAHFHYLFQEEGVETIDTWKEKFSRQSASLGRVSMYLAGLAFRLNFKVYALNADRGVWQPLDVATVRRSGAGTTVRLAYMSAGGVYEDTLNHYEPLIITPGPEDLVQINRLNAAYQARTNRAMGSGAAGLDY